MEQYKAIIMNQTKLAIVGNPLEVKEQLQAFLDVTEADELIIHSIIYDHQARFRSYEIIAEVTNNL
jgi:alkanesulfonate monooxygenase SsuD/methylene tetrahydromethanopterin reductase-like flavin-dependent oxidoreductase (luciferase family)